MVKHQDRPATGATAQGTTAEITAEAERMVVTAEGTTEGITTRSTGVETTTTTTTTTPIITIRMAGANTTTTNAAAAATSLIMEGRGLRHDLSGSQEE